MNTILKTLGELLETMVREANSAAFKEYDRELERQWETISDLKVKIFRIYHYLERKRFAAFFPCLDSGFYSSPGKKFNFHIPCGNPEGCI